MAEIVSKYQPMPNDQEMLGHLINTLAVSPDIVTVEPAAAISGTLAALSEKGRMIATETTVATVRQRYNDLSRQNLLPPHLQTAEAYEARYRQLVGVSEEERTNCELRATIARNRTRVNPEAQKQFEYRMARVGAWLIHDAAETYPMGEFMTRESILMPIETQGVTKILTGDGLGIKLPTKHAGIVQAVPTFNEAFARLSEAGSGYWQNVALLGATHYSAELARLLAQNACGVSLKRVVASATGMQHGAQELRDSMPGNKRIQKGFGALILANVGDYPIEEAKAVIDTASDLLAPAGVLIINDLVELKSGTGTVHDLIKHARTVLDCNPYQVTSITQTNDEMVGGRQAFFVNPVKR